MKSPYALPLRLRRQRLDDVRQQIAALVAEQAAMSAQAANLAARAVAEAGIRGEAAAGSEAWFDWQRRTCDRLLCEVAALDVPLARLRGMLRDELAQVVALEEAEQRLVLIEQQRRARREQALADDRAATIHHAGLAA